MVIIDYKTHFQITFKPYGQWFNHYLRSIKELTEKRWIPDKKYWYVPGKYRDEVLELKSKCMAEFILPESQEPQITGDIPPMPEPEFTPNLKQGQMRHYQLQGVAQGLNFKRFINGDQPGLGKTLQSIATILQANAFPCFVICPATIKQNWQREWHQWTDKKAMIVDDKVKNTWHRYYEVGSIDVFICNYESMKKYLVKSMPEKKNLRRSDQIELKPQVDNIKSIIIDESHRVKDPSTLQTKLCLRVCTGKEYVILLSGTPIVNKPIDLYPQLAIIGHLNTFGGRKGFLDRYCEGGKGANNLRELNYKLNTTCFFRREKKDVAKDLPERQLQTIICDITTRNEYQTAKLEFEKYLKESGCSDREVAKKMRAEILVKMGVLRAISARGKMNEVKEFTDEIIEAGEKLVLFCSHRNIVNTVKELYPNAVTVTGMDTLEVRQKNIDAFQNDPKCQLIICNIKAAGVGITLTASSRVAFIEYPWSPADVDQCIDRVHRIGAVNNVMATFFLGGNTIDEQMYEIINDKREISNAILGASEDAPMVVFDKMLSLFNF